MSREPNDIIDAEVTAEIIDGEDFDPFTEDNQALMLGWLERDGDLYCPCSRYGRRTSDCAPWAVAMLLIYIDANGPPDCGVTDLLESFMGYAVNDSDSPLSLVLEHGGILTDCVTHDDVRYVVEEAADLAREDIERRLKGLTLGGLRDVIELLDGLET